jgi:multiple RNA-binding domain-containing protein 1
VGDEELDKQRQERRNKRKADFLEPSSSNDKPRPDTLPRREKKEKSSKKGSVSFEEFMSVMQPKSKRKAWQNGDAPPEQTMADITAPLQAIQKKADKKAKKAAAIADAAASSQTDNNAIGVEDPDEQDEQDAVANDVGLTDEEYMRLRMKHKVGVDLDAAIEPIQQFEQSDDEELEATGPAAADSESEDEEQVDAQQEAQRKKAEEAALKDQQIVDQIMKSGRLFVRNLPFAATQDELQAFFQSFGTVSQVSNYPSWRFLGSTKTRQPERW